MNKMGLQCCCDKQMRVVRKVGTKEESIIVCIVVYDSSHALAQLHFLPSVHRTL